MLPKPEPRGPKPPKRIARSVGITHNRQPRCSCGDKYSEHSYGAAPSKPACLKCAGCRGYSPARKAKPWSKPRCKHCGRADGSHGQLGSESMRACPGYEPARRGSKASRRTPTAAVKLRADILWSKLVKAHDYLCDPTLPVHDCGGGDPQAMHGAPRTYGHTRHLLINGWKGCPKIHKYFSHRKEEWSIWCAEQWGPETTREVWSIARRKGHPDYEAELAKLQAEAKSRGLE